MKGDDPIILRNICKSYSLPPSPFGRIKRVSGSVADDRKQINALSDVSLSLSKGDVLGIVGRNGSGKSTLLRIIAGITSPTSGSVTVRGKVSPLLELGAGFDPNLTGRQNVVISGAVLGMSRRDIDESFEGIVSFSGIGAFIDQPVRMYSSGMYVRLAFSLATSLTPDILIVDEALAVGDTLFQAKCHARLQELRARGVTIIFVSHSLDLVSRLCNKACLMDKGRLLSFGPPARVLGDYHRIMANQGAAAQPQRGEGPEPEECRYGNGRARIERIEIFDGKGCSVSDLIKNQEYLFRVHVQFLDRISEPIFSFRIRDSKGADVTGTNTMYHGMETRVFHPNERVTVTFSQKIPLRRGEYTLSASCAGFENGAYVVYDRRYDSLHFRVTDEKSSIGLVDLAASVRVTRTERPRFGQA